ncbi:hypothetical protein MJO28_014630 [Puccinia striiformis f. sp. tritici]|uniref:Uncharacterized protein n=1 Tax=Puccinia striiformis f. sp. tritici TaxID=168172 RepID=A0ACC0DV87_9BASI|nr:hypothetical protein MJO28_014630 [Puccinia striiformis f. sp. tritici]
MIHPNLATSTVADIIPSDYSPSQTPRLQASPQPRTGTNKVLSQKPTTDAAADMTPRSPMIDLELDSDDDPINNGNRCSSGAEDEDEDKGVDEDEDEDEGQTQASRVGGSGRSRPTELTAYLRGLSLPDYIHRMGNEMANMTSSNRDTVLFYVIANLSTKVERLEQGLTSNTNTEALPTTAIVPTTLSHANQCKNYDYGDKIKRFVTAAARTCLLRYDIEAYSQGPGAHAQLPDILVLTLVMDLAYRRLHLPPLGGTDDPTATQYIGRFVRERIKHVRNKVRDVLLTGVIDPRTPEKAPAGIPNIRELSRLLWIHLTGNKSCLNATQIDNQMEESIRVRFAYLRLATIENYMNPCAKTISQWDTMDAQLRYNRRQPDDYSQAWRRLITERDEDLFANQPVYEHIQEDLSRCLCPTHEEILARMADL